MVRKAAIEQLKKEVNRLFGENKQPNKNPGKEREFTDKINRLNKLIFFLESHNKNNYNLNDINEI